MIVHELAHQLFCRWFGVAVLDVCYFRLGNPAGYVLHERIDRPMANILIGIGPFFVNTIVGAVIAMPAVLPILKFQSSSPIDYFLIWLGVSVAMHSFPSTGDAKSIWESMKAPGTPVWAKVLATPIVGLIYVGAIGSIFWLDVLYGIAVAGLLPTLLIKALA